MLFGLSDPYIIGAYLGCILCVVFCCAWTFFKEKDENEEEEGES